MNSQELEKQDTKKQLTSRQQEVFDYIKAQTTEFRRPPTVREIANRFNISSTNGVRSILAALIKKGYISRSPRTSRGLEILQDDSPTLDSSLAEIPIVGRVAAGEPILAVQNLEGTITVDRDFIARRKDVFALRVKGDSMINAGIFDGDKIIVKKQNTANNGDIVVAMLEDEATVKRFFKENGHFRLQPENDEFEPIITNEVAILGKVVSLVRYY